MIGNSTTKVAVNLSLSEKVVERYHYQARYHEDKSRFHEGQVGPDVSIQYDGDELTDDEVDLVEDYVAFLLWDPAPRYFD
jgi:hypothetical protein